MQIDEERGVLGRRLETTKAELGERVEELTRQREALEEEFKKVKAALADAVEAREDARNKMMRTQRSIDTMVTNASKLAVAKARARIMRVRGCTIACVPCRALACESLPLRARACGCEQARVGEWAVGWVV